MRNPNPCHPAFMFYKVEPIRYEVESFVPKYSERIAIVEYGAVSCNELLEAYIPIEYCEAWIEANDPEFVKEFTFYETNEEGQREKYVSWVDLFYYDLPKEYQEGILNDFINNSGII